MTFKRTSDELCSIKFGVQWSVTDLCSVHVFVEFLRLLTQHVCLTLYVGATFLQPLPVNPLALSSTLWESCHKVTLRLSSNLFLLNFGVLMDLNKLEIFISWYFKSKFVYLCKKKPKGTSISIYLVKFTMPCFNGSKFIHELLIK